MQTQPSSLSSELRESHQRKDLKGRGLLPGGMTSTEALIKGANKASVVFAASMLLLGGLNSAQGSSPGEHLASLTVAGDALLGGVTQFGTLASDSGGGPGFKVSVTQGVIQVEEVHQIAEQTISRVITEDIWGHYYTGYYQDVWGTITRDVWVPPQGFYTYTEVQTGTDEYGNPVMTWQDVWQETMPGFWTTESEWGITGTEWVSDPTPVWGVVGTTERTEVEVIPAHTETRTVSRSDAPLVSFDAAKTGTIWQWVNPTATSSQILMRLSSGGLAFPSVESDGALRRTLLNERELVFAEVNAMAVPADRVSEGTQVGRGKVIAWAEQGGELSTAETGRLNGPSWRETVELDGGAMHLKRTDSASAANPVTKSTRILADFAEFGGQVNVKGVLRVPASGDLSMGSFTEGPQP